MRSGARRCSYLPRKLKSQSLMECIEERAAPDPNTGCFIWTGAQSKAGYGQIRVLGKTYYVHRLVFEKRFGLIPEGQCVCHACDNRWCVRPEHMFLGDKAANNRDMFSKRRHHFGERCSWAKLTNAQVEVIRGSSESQTVLGRRYGVSPSWIWNLKNSSSEIRRSPL